MDAAIKVIRFMLDNREEKPTIRKISEGAKINYRIAYEKVLSLESQGMIRITKAGNAKTCEMTSKFNNLVFEAEYQRRNDLLRKKDFLVLQKRLSKLNFPYIALIFGSHAKGTAKTTSDIDIMTIGGEEKEIRTTINLWPEKIHLTTITYDAFNRMAASKGFNVVNEAMKNNIILIGIEEYYRLKANAE